MLVISYGIIYNTMITKTQLKILAYLIDHRDRLLGIRELAKNVSVAYYLGFGTLILTELCPLVSGESGLHTSTKNRTIILL